MKKTVCMILAVLLIAATFVACNDRSLVGTWITSGSDGLEMRLVFESDGSGYMTARGGMIKYEFEYSAKSGTLELNYEDDESYSYGYSVSGDTLTLLNDEGTELVYTKKQ